MQRMKGMDAAFLYLETPAQHMHVVGVLVLQPPQAEEPGDRTNHGGASDADARRIGDHLAGRLAAVREFRRRPVEVPLGLHHPVWIPFEDIDPRQHVQIGEIDAPGDQNALAQAIGQIASVQLARDRPLWELHVLKGLEGGAVAAVLKAHHATMDGMAGAELMAHLFDLTPELPEVTSAQAGNETASSTQQNIRLDPAAEDPGSTEMVWRALTDQWQRSSDWPKALWKTGSALPAALFAGAKTIWDGVDEEASWVPPHTSFNGSLTPQRAVGFGKVQLEDVLQIRRQYGCTVNDVVLAAVTGATRKYLEDRGEDVSSPLTASVPVSERAGSADSNTGESGANRVSTLFVRLPVHREDPVEQLHQVARRSRAAKKLHAGLGSGLLEDWVDLAPPPLLEGGARMYSDLGIADRVAPVQNLVISNVPGPPIPLYAGGALLTAAYPLGPVMEGAGLNITVISYHGEVHIGVLACARAVPAPRGIAERIEAAITVLRERAELETKRNAA